MREEFRARANARRQRRRNAPLVQDPSESDMDYPSNRPPSSHELHSLGPANALSASASGRQTDDATNLRSRKGARSFAGAGSGTSVEHSARDGLIDAVRVPRL